MTPDRLTQIEALLTAKLFPHGGFEEVRELIEAVRELQTKWRDDLKHLATDVATAREALRVAKAERDAIAVAIMGRADVLDLPEIASDVTVERWDAISKLAIAKEALESIRERGYCTCVCLDIATETLPKLYDVPQPTPAGKEQGA